MTAQDIIAEFTRLGIRLSRNGDKLRWAAPAGSMTPERLEKLRGNKAAILAALAARTLTITASPPDPPSPSPSVALPPPAPATPAPASQSWHLDRQGRLHFASSETYAPLADGSGWVLVNHETRRLIRPGTLEVER